MVGILLAFLVPPLFLPPDYPGKAPDAVKGARPVRPCFVADFTFQVEGRTYAGRVVVEPWGVVHVEHLPRRHGDTVARMLADSLNLGMDPAVRIAADDSGRFFGARRECIVVEGPFGPVRWLQGNQTIRILERRQGLLLQREFLETMPGADGERLPTIEVTRRQSTLGGDNRMEVRFLRWQRIGKQSLPVGIRDIAFGPTPTEIIENLGALELIDVRLLSSSGSAGEKRR